MNSVQNVKKSTIWRLLCDLPADVTGGNVFDKLELLDMVNLNTAACSHKAQHLMIQMSAFASPFQLKGSTDLHMSAFRWASKRGMRVRLLCISFDDNSRDQFKNVVAHQHNFQELELFLSDEESAIEYEAACLEQPDLFAKVFTLSTFMLCEEDYLSGRLEQLTNLHSYVSCGECVPESWLIGLLGRNPKMQLLEIRHEREPYSEALFHTIAESGKHLLKLHLDATLSDAFLIILSDSCIHLQNLSIRGNKWDSHVTDAGLMALAQGCPLLQEVSLLCRLATDASLVAFARHCPSLTSLTIDESGLFLTSAVLQALGQHGTKLRTLAGFWKVTALPSPETCAAVFATLESAKFSALEESHSTLFIQALTYMHALKEMNLRCRALPLALEVLAQSCRRLRKVHLIHHVGEAAYCIDTLLVALVSGNPLLHDLALIGAFITTDATLLALAQSCPRLESLYASHSSRNGYGAGYTSEAIIALAQSCARLKKLDGGICGAECGDEAVLALAKGCPLLRQLDLSACAQLTEAALLHLVARCACLRVVTVSKEAFCVETLNRLRGLVTGKMGRPKCRLTHAWR